MQWYNGSLLTGGDEQSDVVVPFDSLGLRFGASVFTTLRVYDQDVSSLRSQYAAHCDRLTQSLRAFGWSLPDWSAVAQGCAQLQQSYTVLRITIFANGREWITGRSLPAKLAEQQKTGLCCWLAPSIYSRSLPTHKTGNYLACHLARQQAESCGAKEAILTNVQGDWLETATGNLWGWAAGQWWSPVGNHPSNRCLPGLMRAKIAKLLDQNGQLVNEQSWSREVWDQFEAIAYSNCVIELMPVHTIISGQTTLRYNPQHPSLVALRTLIDKNGQIKAESYETGDKQGKS